MKKCVYGFKVYDYTSYTEAEEHIREMNQHGWCVITGKHGEAIRTVERGSNYTVGYLKNRQKGERYERKTIKRNHFIHNN